MNFYEKVIALAMLQSGSTCLRTAFTMQRVGLLGQFKPIDLKREIEDLQNRYTLVDTMLLERHDNVWMLHSEDRSTCITEDFLATCNPDWAQELRKAMVNKVA